MRKGLRPRFFLKKTRPNNLSMAPRIKRDLKVGLGPHSLKRGFNRALGRVFYGHGLKNAAQGPRVL